MIALKCQCCGIERSFADGDAAFDAGWDASPMFTQHVCCDLCPGVCVVLGKGHSADEGGQPVGTFGTVLGSLFAPGKGYAYFVEWDTKPKVAVLVIAAKLGLPQ